MTDDFLADFERELHAAARRRQAPRRVHRRLLAPALAAVATVGVVFLALSLAAPVEREVEVASGLPAGTQFELPGVGPAACVPVRGQVAPPDSMRVFRRDQHAPDALTREELGHLFGAADYDPQSTRSPSGLGERVVLSPTSSLGCDGRGQPGVCVVVDVGSRCFTLTEIDRGRALLLPEPGRVIGLVPDGVATVEIVTQGKRIEGTVVENAYRVEVPDDARFATVELRGSGAPGCAPTAEMRRAVPALEADPVPGGVPPAIRRSFGGRDSAVIGQYARLWGGGDGVAYWVVPQLRCDDPSAKADAVCVVPLFEGEEKAEQAGGGSACAPLDEMGDTWIHFPLRDGGAAVAGLAPPGATEARVRVRQGGHEQRFEVRGGVWGGSFDDYRPRGEVGGLDVEFDAPVADAAAVTVLNGTTVTGLGRTVMDALERVNYEPAKNDVGDWSDPGVQRTVVYHLPGSAWLGDRIAIYLGERFGVARPEVREMTVEARELGGEDAEAVVVAGRDLAP